MISKEQYRSILLEQMRENQQKKILQKNERRSIMTPVDKLFIVGQHKKLHQHQQPAEQELIYVNMPSKPMSSASSRHSVQNRKMRFSKEIEIRVYKEQQDEKTLRRQYGVLEQQPEKKAFSPRSPARSKVFTQGAVGPQVQAIYQQGARNLLKLENLDMNELENQHRKRLQMQKQLKEQMQEIQRRKKQERERRLEEQKREMQKDRRYQEEIEKRRMQESKKKEQRILRQSEMAQSRPEPKLSKFQSSPHREINKTQEKKKTQKTQEQKVEVVKFPILNSYRDSRRKDKKHSKRVSSQQQPIRSYKNDPTVTEALSSCQSDLYSNTSRSSSTAKKQEYRKMQMMISQVRRDIKMQEVMFKREIEKARREATQAIADKVKLEKQFKKLMKQVSSMGNSLESLDQYYQFDKRKFRAPDNVSSAPQSIRRRKLLSKKESIVIPLRPDNEPMMSKHYLTDQPKEQLGLNSLMAESKKIPIVITNGSEKVTMSRIEEYAVQSRLRPKKSKSGKSKISKPPKQDSMNEFLQNPYGMNMEKSNRRSFESVDFNLSSVDSSLAMDVGNLVQKEKKAIMARQVQ